VVYVPEPGNKITRKIVHGPTLYLPTNSQEWLHQFQWHGTDLECLKSTGLNRKVAGGLNFTKLRLVPDQLYYDVVKVRAIKLNALVRSRSIDKNNLLSI
jgi:hypothetical protein